MAPFPEAEDMTIKRLYVALKRDDMQLLQMGAHKLHEKYHTGYDFTLKDDLRQILSYIEEQAIPLDIKDLLVRTINKILNGEKPEIQEEYGEQKPSAEIKQNEPADNLPLEETEDKTSNINALWGTMPNNQESTVSYQKQEEVNSKPAMEETTDEGFEPFEEEPSVVEKVEAPIEQENSEFLQDESNNRETSEEHKEETVIFTPVPQVEENVNTQNEQVPAKEEKEIVEENKYELKNVMVFYDDKASFTDWEANKLYRNKLVSIGLGEKTPSMGEIVQAAKNAVDIPTEEIGEVLKMLSTIKGEVYFITSSKSENVLKTFKDNNINFAIPLVKTEESEKPTLIIPLFGLSNIFFCPKCGKKECCLNFENKTLTLQCSNCGSVMYPDITESSNSETNSSPYYWISAIQYMSNADTWILINPPLEANKAIIVELLKTAFEVSKPKRVYILSRETTKREFFKQAFLEIEPNTDIRAEYIMQDILCEEFINNEITPLRACS